MSALERLASEAGLQIRWQDAAGQKQEVSAESLERVLDALGLPAATDEEIAASRRRLAAMREDGAARFVTARVGEPIALPAGLSGPTTIEFESGARREIDLSAGRIEALEEPGYHRLLHEGGETVIALAPRRCFSTGDIAPGFRPWGVAVQVPSLRDDADRPFGDFGALASAAAALGECGADILAISPVHALFPADPDRFSPYGPSSRRFLNVVLADPVLAGAEPEEGNSTSELIEWEEAIPRRMTELRHLFETMEPKERQSIAPPAGDVGLHALHDALHAHFAQKGMKGWRDWPQDYRSPNSPAIRAFAAEHEDEIAFYAWLQGLADRSLAKAQQAARNAGMALGLVSDLAVGVDPSGADCWRDPASFLEGLSVGAPPDLLGPEGQDWGLTTFNPLTLHATRFLAFRETLAAAMAHAGGVRIDHVLGFRRVWVVPHGAPSSEGCYLAMPQRDLANIVALESWRHRCIVIGEDLGTVPEGLRDEMADAGIYGMRVLWFERGEDDTFTDPEQWDEQAAAMTSTHDLPTLAGWWQGRDIEWARKIGRSGQDPQERQAERMQLWQRIVRSGHAEGDPPADSDTFATAALAHVADSACSIALVPVEDLLGLAEQPNLPGTTDEHPNWRRRLPGRIDRLLDRPDVEKRIAALAAGRKP